MACKHRHARTESAKRGILASLAMVAVANVVLAQDPYIDRLEFGENYRVPMARETSQEWRDAHRDRFLTVTADLDADGVENVASLLLGATESQPHYVVSLVVRQRFLMKVLEEAPFEALPELGVVLAPPGVYQTLCGKDPSTCGPEDPKTVSLTTPALELFEHAGRRFLFVWDSGGETYLKVELGKRGR